MRAKLLTLRKTMASLFGGRKYSHEAGRCDAHMNELPIPCGPWEPYYNSKQAYYTATLVGGAAWLIFSFVMVLYTNSIFLNWGPPAQPAPPSDMVEECEDIE